VTTNRPYQKACNLEEALVIIKNLSGKRLDPIAASALVALCQRGEIEIPPSIPMPIPRPEEGVTVIPLDELPSAAARAAAETAPAAAAASVV
jgi:hypothetical protein